MSGFPKSIDNFCDVDPFGSIPHSTMMVKNFHKNINEDFAAFKTIINTMSDILFFYR